MYLEKGVEMKKKAVFLAFVSVFLLTALSLCVVFLLESQMAYASPYASIDVDTAYNMVTNGSYPDLAVLDVRTQSEYDGGHIYGAVWIPVSELEARIGELAGHENHEIIVYCLSGGRSVTASGILDSYNFTKVYNMLGGISAWQSAGYPVWVATVHNVNTTFNYDTIQAAIDAPQTLDGHTILVDAGIYYEHVVVKKSISLIGENRSTTVVDGNGTGNVIIIDISVHHINVTGFTIRNGTNGVFIKTSDYNIISGNVVTDNQNGIQLFATCACNPARENTIRNNIIKNNEFGISLEISIHNIIYNNSFINNTQQAYLPTLEYPNFWDDGYPSGGNYWSDYSGTDFYSGPYQNVTGSDGIGDTPYVINENNQDNYPLMKPWTPTPPLANATIDIKPDTLNLKSRGRWITAYIELSEGYNLSDIDRATILLNGTVPVDSFWVDKPLESVIGDYDCDGTPDLMVKFSRCEVIEYIRDVRGVTHGNVNLTITGELCDGTLFEDSDMIRVIMPGDANCDGCPNICDPVIPEFPSSTILPILMVLSLTTVVFKLKKKKQ